MREPADPPTRNEVWRHFLLWVLGIPLAMAAALAIIYAALRVSGGEMAWQAVSGMGTALIWGAVIVLLYPVMLVVWVADLRRGLRQAAEWQALSPAEQLAARSLATTTPKRRVTRSKGAA